MSFKTKTISNVQFSFVRHNVSSRWSARKYFLGFFTKLLSNKIKKNEKMFLLDAFFPNEKRRMKWWIDDEYLTCILDVERIREKDSKSLKMIRIFHASFSVPHINEIDKAKQKSVDWFHFVRHFEIASYWNNTFSKEIMNRDDLIQNGLNHRWEATTKQEFSTR